MDLVSLDRSTFQTTGLIEEYDSLVWKERYYGNGEIVLASTQIEASRAALPENSLVSLRDSTEVMIIESHEIKTDPEEGESVEIRGRSFDTFLENRVPMHDPSRGFLLPKQYSPAEAVAAYAWDAVVNASNFNLPLVGFSGLPTSGQSFTNANPGSLNAIPNLMVSETVPYQMAARWWPYKRDDVSKIVNEILVGNFIGIRTIRPDSSSAAEMSFVIPAPGVDVNTWGNIVRTGHSATSKLRLDVYFGVDRSANQGIYTPVIFNVEDNDLEGLSAFTSIVGTKNVVMTLAKTAGGTIVVTHYDPSAAAGLDRRVMLVDDGDRNSDDQAAVSNSTLGRAQYELALHQKTVIFDGDVRPDAEYKYRQHYDLGDLITVRGTHGLSGTMRVVEYIRTEEYGVETGYPTLAEL